MHPSAVKWLFSVLLLTASFLCRDVYYLKLEARRNADMVHSALKTALAEIAEVKRFAQQDLMDIVIAVRKQNAEDLNSCVLKHELDELARRQEREMQASLNHHDFKLKETTLRLDAEMRHLVYHQHKMQQELQEARYDFDVLMNEIEAFLKNKTTEQETLYTVEEVEPKKLTPTPMLTVLSVSFL